MQFPSPLLSAVASALSFCAGALAALLIAVGLMDETLLEAQVRNEIVEGDASTLFLFLIFLAGL